MSNTELSLKKHRKGETKMNLYSNKGKMADLTDLQAERIAEIELWLLWKKIQGVTAPKSYNKAIELLLLLLDPHGIENPLSIEKLKQVLLNSDILEPNLDEIIIYMRFQGLGLNKVTRITGKQHVYLKDLLHDVDLSFLIPRLNMNWEWSQNPQLIDTIRVVARELFYTSEERFYFDFNVKALRSAGNQNFIINRSHNSF